MSNYLVLDGIGHDYISADFLEIASACTGVSEQELHQRIIARYKAIQKIYTPTREKDKWYFERVTFRKQELLIFNFYFTDMGTFDIVDRFREWVKKGVIRIDREYHNNLTEYCQLFNYIAQDFKIMAHTWGVSVRDVLLLDYLTKNVQQSIYDIVIAIYKKKGTTLVMPPDGDYSLPTYLETAAPRKEQQSVQAPAIKQQPLPVKTHYQQSPTSTGTTQKVAPTARTSSVRQQQKVETHYKKPEQYIFDSSKEIRFEGLKAPNFFIMCEALGLNANEILYSIGKSAVMDKLVAALYDNAKRVGLQRARSKKVTKNEMYIRGRYYPNFQEACEQLKLDYMAVSYYKSEQACTAKKAVYDHL